MTAVAQPFRAAPLSTLKHATLRILLLAIYTEPEPIPKTSELARELKRRGHDVHVITAFPHYPSGHLYPGYRLSPWMRELRDGVPVLRTYIYPYHGTSTGRRMVNYITWMLSSMMASFLTPKSDVLYVWHPPLTVGVSAWVIAKLKRIPYVYDVQDLWPESALASGLMKPGRVVDLLYRLSDWVYARAHRILVVSEDAKNYLASRGVNPSKIMVAKHWFDGSAFLTPSNHRNVRNELGLAGKFVVMFAGNLGMVQGLETVVEAAIRLRQDPGIVFVFVGDGADRPRLEQMVADGRLANVRFVGAHPAADMPAFFRAADALVVHVRPSSVADHAIPTKTLAYLASGRPILCGMRGAGARVVRDSNAGLVVEPGDADALAAAVRTLADMPGAAREALGARGRAYFLREFDRDRIMDFYEDVITSTARRGD